MWFLLVSLRCPCSMAFHGLMKSGSSPTTIREEDVVKASVHDTHRTEIYTGRPMRTGLPTWKVTPFLFSRRLETIHRCVITHVLCLSLCIWYTHTYSLYTSSVVVFGHLQTSPGKTKSLFLSPVSSWLQWGSNGSTEAKSQGFIHNLLLSVSVFDAIWSFFASVSNDYILIHYWVSVFEYINNQSIFGIPTLIYTLHRGLSEKSVIFHMNHCVEPDQRTRIIKNKYSENWELERNKEMRPLVRPFAAGRDLDMTHQEQSSSWRKPQTLRDRCYST